MMFVVVFAAVLAVASAQYNPFSSSQLPRFNPSRFPQPSPSPLPTRFPLPSPQPTFPAPLPVVNRVNGEQAATIIRYDSDSGPDGSFAYAVQTDNGINLEAQGTPQNLGGNPPAVPVVIQGRYSYTSPEGQLITITYIANENGFQPQGDAIPTSPPIPEANLRGLQYIAQNPPAAQKK